MSTFNFQLEPYQPTYLVDDETPIDDVPPSAIAVENVHWRNIPGLVGAIAKFIFEGAPRPLEEVAVAGAIAYFTGIVGRAYNVSGMGLNQYVALIAGTGLGKNAASSGMDTLNNAVQTKLMGTTVSIRKGMTGFASAEGLCKHMVETPCCLHVLGEVGFIFAEMNSKKANPVQKAVRRALLDMYTKSGGTKEFGGISYSDKAKNVPRIVAIAGSLFGEATPSTFYGGFNEQSIREGFLTRLLIIERELKTTVPFNETAHLVQPSEQLITTLAALYGHVLEVEARADNTKTYNWITVGFDDYCKDALRTILKNIDAEIDKNNLAGAETVSEIYTRFYEKLLKLAALIAVGVNPQTPVVTRTELEYAYRVVNHGTQQLIKRLQTGKLGEPNEQLEQHEQLLNCLKRYLKNDWKPSFEKNYGIPEHFKSKRLVTYKYIHNMLHRQPAFKNAHNPKAALENIIQTFEKAEYIVKVPKHDVKMRGKSIAEMWRICNLRE